MFIGKDSPSGAHERERSSSSVRALLFSKRRDLLISSAEARPSEIFSERPLVPMTFAAALPPRSDKGKSENLMRASIDFLSLKRNTLYRSPEKKSFLTSTAYLYGFMPQSLSVIFRAFSRMLLFPMKLSAQNASASGRNENSEHPVHISGTAADTASETYSALSLPSVIITSSSPYNPDISPFNI